MSDIYRTISAPAEAVFTEKRSKFLAFAFPVLTESEIKEHVRVISKKYFDARHVCWAYMLGPDRNSFRANDNGEPSGTAGKPILGQINSFELTNILIIVVRYFGGIKLGTSGLIAAYRQAARDVLDIADIIECHETLDLHLSFPYVSLNEVLKITREQGIRMIDNKYDNSCYIHLQIERDRFDFVKNRLESIDGISFLNDSINN